MKSPITGRALLIAMLFIFGCSSGKSAGDMSTADGAVTTSNKISAANGGVVSDASGNTALTVPPGALAMDTEITLSILPKQGNAVVEISAFGPNGLQFSQPATLVIKAAASLATAGQTLTIAVDDGTGTTSAPFVPVAGSTYASGAATALISHFTSFTIIATGSSSQCVPLGGDCSSETCCMGNDPNYYAMCNHNSYHCCVPAGGLCGLALGSTTVPTQCCGVAENQVAGVQPVTECNGEFCCLLTGATGCGGAGFPKGNGCCSGTCSGDTCI